MSCVWPYAYVIPTETCIPSPYAQETGVITSALERAFIQTTGAPGWVQTWDYVGKQSVTPVTNTFKISASAVVRQIAATPRSRVCLEIGVTNERGRPSGITIDCVDADQPMRKLSTSFEGTYYRPVSLSVYVYAQTWGENVSTFYPLREESYQVGLSSYDVEVITYTTS